MRSLALQRLLAGDGRAGHHQEALDATADKYPDAAGVHAAAEVVVAAHVAGSDPHTQYVPKATAEQELQEYFEPRRSGNVVWNQTSDTFSREGMSTGVTPIHERMRRCLLNDDGTVNYYLSLNDSTLKADGTAAVLDGTDGQVMVEIPKCYVRVSTLFNGDIKREISDYPGRASCCTLRSLLAVCWLTIPRWTCGTTKIQPGRSQPLTSVRIKPVCMTPVDWLILMA